jgi:A/G-specific adenine glycosylase
MELFLIPIMKLLKIPGVGPYTAAAIASIAFNESVAAIDGNAKRVYSRLFEIQTPIDQPGTIKSIENEAEKVMNPNRPGDFNQAIMELGATVCLPKKPICNACPVADFCKAFKNGTHLKLPLKIRKVKVRNRYFNYYIFKYNGKTALLERVANDIWKGLNEFPLYESEKEMDHESLLSIAIEKWGIDPNSISKVVFSDQIKHVLTHQRIFAKFIVVDLSSMPKKIKLDTNLNTISDRPVSRLTDIFLSMDEKFL